MKHRNYQFFVESRCLGALRSTTAVWLLLALFAGCASETPPVNPFDPEDPVGLLLNQLLAPRPSCRDTGSCIILMTTSSYSPDFQSSQGTSNGVLGADAICQKEAKSKGFSGTFKALLVAFGVRESAVPSSQVDWVLGANVDYYSQFSSSDPKVKIGRTNASAVFSFPLDAAFGASTSVADQFFTGLNTDWSRSTSDCNGWTSATSGSFIAGWSADTSNAAINFGTGTCNATTTARLACVEQ